MRQRLWFCALLVGQGAAAQQSEVSARVERLTAAGNTSVARVLVDSVLGTATEGSDDYVEALYWHAVLDSTAAGAERSYLRVVVEYPLARRASAALLRLAELELARQARDRAKRHLEQLSRDYPQSEHAARAQYLAARLAREDGEHAKACALLASARASVDSNDVELRNQILYLHSSCVAVPSGGGGADSVAGGDSVRRDTAAATSATGRFAIQVAAFNTQREATALAQQLQRRGVAARVVGTRAPFRVRVGRYQTREAARRAMTQAGLRGIIVDAEPR
jgi:outer membrane protein assembly factor BamD (BamD/ComL family)